RLLAVLFVGAVDDQHAVEVVVLVLDDAGGHSLELPAHIVALGILALELDESRALDRDADALEREAAFLLDLLVAGHGEARVDDGARALLVRGEDEQTAKDADLGRG